MHFLHTSRRRLPLFAGVTLILVLMSVGVAQASGETFGELKRFGAPGTEFGQLTPNKVEETPTNREVVFEPWHAIGVEPENNDVFVVEEDEEPKEPSAEVLTRFFRLQELNGTSGAPIAHAEFSFKSERSADGDHETDTIDGIAVDPKTKTLYFLLTEARKTETEIAGKELIFPEEGESTAAALYAFKTVPNGTKLEPAVGASKSGELVTPEVLEPNSETPGKALLEPHGITVDPKTGEIVIVAHDDECVEGEENEGECTADDLADPEDHYVAQRITQAGALGQLYVDSGSVFKPAQVGNSVYVAPQSPVVVGPEKEERLLASHRISEPESGEQAGVKSEETVDQFPNTEAKIEAEALKLPDVEGVQGGIEESGEEAENIGGTLAVSQDGSTLYGLTTIENEEGGGTPEEALAITERSAQTLAPIGFTGGQRPTTSHGTDKCVLQPANEGGEHVQIAAGKEGVIFVLAPEYLTKPQVGSFPTQDAIIEFGPKGEGCPAASVKGNEVVLEVNGSKVASGTSIPAGKPAVLSSFVTQGDALSVTWEIEDETTHEPAFKEEQKSDQNQTPSLGHEFKAAGKYKVTEKIKTDNLDTPELTVTRAIEVKEETEAIKVVTQPAKSVTAAEGAVADFESKATSKPNASIKWLVSKNGGTSFVADTEDQGTVTNKLEVTAAKAKNGYQYEAEFERSAR